MKSRKNVEEQPLSPESRPKSKKRFWKVLLWIVILAFLLFAVLLVLGIKVNFLIGEELKVSLSPSESFSSTDSSLGLEKTITLENTNFFQCQTECRYRLLDLDNLKVMASGELLLNHSDRVEQKILLPKKSGNKLNLYSYELECNNIPNLVCFTESKKVHQSALFFVESKFGAQELKWRDKLKENLDQILLIYAQNLAQLQKERTMLSSLFFFSTEAQEITRKLDQLELDLAEQRGLISSAISSWQKSELEKIDPDEIIKQFIQINSSLDKNGLEAEQLLSSRNQTFFLLNQINGDKEKILGAYYYSPSIGLELSRLGKLQGQLENKENFSEKALLEEVQSYAENLSQALWSYQQEAKNLSFYYSSLIGLNFTGEPNCTSLAALGQEVSEFNLNHNLSFSLNSLSLFVAENCLSNKTGIYFPNLSFFPGEIFKFSSTTPTVDTHLSLGEQKAQCCVFGTCHNYYENYSRPPVIFIHGHAFNEENTPEASTAAFAKIQEKMQEEGFIDAGQLDLSSISEDLSKCSAPAAFRATYYYTPYFSLGDYKVTVQKSERIENYALRLKEIIDFVKQKTGREKVTIIAHSMGGLVLREYVSLFGADDLDKAILINAPNHGVSGKVEKYCSVIGASKECEDLSSGSVFLSKLNVMPLSPEVAAKFYNIISTGCEMDDGKEGDGIVTKDSAYLESGKNYFIRGQCTDALKTNLHNEILEPGKYPQTYQLFLQILRE